MFYVYGAAQSEMYCMYIFGTGCFMYTMLLRVIEMRCTYIFGTGPDLSGVYVAYMRRCLEWDVYYIHPVPD